MNSVLYYPKFEPNHRWLRSVLLLVDSIHRVIPAEAKHRDSRLTQELIDVMPAAFQTIAPTEQDKYFDDLNFERLERAFAKIKAQNGGRPDKSMTFLFGQNDNVTLQGDVWLSNAKLEERVRELLFHYDLATDVRNPFTDSRPFGDTFPVNEEASNLIVSYVTDRIAQRTGMDTITDSAMPYAVQSLDALNISPQSIGSQREGILASAIAEIAVPAEVSRLDVHRFQVLRESFSDIRRPFAELINSLSAFAKLTRQQSATAAEKRIEAAIAEYTRQMDVYRKTRFARNIDKWTPIGIQTILGIISLNAVKEIRLLFVAVGLGMEVLKDKIASQQEPQKNEKVLRMLCNLEKAIEKAAITELI